MLLNHLQKIDVICAGPVSSLQTLQRFKELTAQPEQGSADLPLLLPAVVSFRLNLAAMAAPDFPINVSAPASFAPPASGHECAFEISREVIYTATYREDMTACAPGEVEMCYSFEMLD